MCRAKFIKNAGYFLREKSLSRNRDQFVGFLGAIGEPGLHLLQPGRGVKRSSAQRPLALQNSWGSQCLSFFLSNLIASYDVNTCLNLASAASATRVLERWPVKKQLEIERETVAGSGGRTFVALVLIRVVLHRLRSESSLQGRDPLILPSWTCEIASTPLTPTISHSHSNPHQFQKLVENPKSKREGWLKIWETHGQTFSPSDPIPLPPPPPKDPP